MPPRPTTSPFLLRACRLRTTPQCRIHSRTLTVLAIESSCDDTSIAILSSPSPTSATLHTHRTITSPNLATRGIHPQIALHHHRTHLSPLLRASLSSLPLQKPDIISVTRGPGMLSSLAVGLDTASGLAVAWNVPLLGINHMQAHLLTPRLVAALSGSSGPQFPFYTLLVSGGHTQLLYSRSLIAHALLAETMDVALGNMLDQCAREILPRALLERQLENVAYGRLLEEFCFPAGVQGEAGCGYGYGYFPPGTAERKQQDADPARAEWRLSPPLNKDGAAKRMMAYSFSGLGSAVEKYMSAHPDISDSERRALGRETMVLAFEHVASRVVLGLKNLDSTQPVKLIASGGVACNSFLRHILQVYIQHVGGVAIELVVPDPKFCTDNAAMVAWAGCEMWRAGWETELGVGMLRKWSLDDTVEGGGVLGVEGWRRREGFDEGRGSIT